MKISHDPARDHIGDALLQEPAIAAYARRTGTRPKWHPPAAVRPLFAEHPLVDVVDEDCGGKVLSAAEAYHWAVANGRYFAEGYWHQLGMGDPWDGERVTVKLPGEAPEPFTRPIVLCPWCRSCRSREGQPANVMPPPSFWDTIIQRFWGNNTILGAAHEQRFPQATAYHFYGEHLSLVVGLLKYGRCVITVETGLLHLASAVTDRIIFLSSATPPTLCVPRGAGWAVVRAERPGLFDPAAVVAAAEKMMDDHKV